MKKILLCVLILLVSVNVFAADVDIKQLGIKQLTEKANSGDAEAQYQLGDAYQYGHDVDQDYEQAIYWYKKAAEQGITAIQTNLGLCYFFGLSVRQGYQFAYMWFYLNLMNDMDSLLIDDAGSALEKIKSNMSDSEIAEAEQMAAEWVEKHQ